MVRHDRVDSLVLDGPSAASLVCTPPTQRPDAARPMPVFQLKTPWEVETQPYLVRFSLARDPPSLLKHGMEPESVVSL